MDASPLNNQVKGFLIIAACLLLAVVLGYTIGTESYFTLLIAVAVVLGCWLWFFSGRFFWVLTIASSFLAGTFPILQGQFTPFQILMAMGLVTFLLEDVIFRRTRLKMPSQFDLLMIAGFMSVIVYHAFRDRLGMKFLGSEVWGGRHYVNVFVGLAAFFVMQSIPMKRGLWAKFPYVVLAVCGFDLLIAVITTIAPGSIYVIYPFYSAVSNSSIQEAIGGDLDVTGRIGAFGNFGFIIIAIVFATVSLRVDLSPEQFLSSHRGIPRRFGRALFGIPHLHSPDRPPDRDGGDSRLESGGDFVAASVRCCLLHILGGQLGNRETAETGPARSGIFSGPLGFGHGKRRSRLERLSHSNVDTLGARILSQTSNRWTRVRFQK